MSQDHYESDLTASREEIATVLSSVIDGVLAGSIQLGTGSEAVTISTPDEMSLEIEFETDDNVSLELELEWPSPDEEVSTGSTPETMPEKEDELSVPVQAADASQSLARFEVFPDKASEWRWRLRHRNGNIIATSGEGYTQRHNALKGLRSVMQNAPEAEVTEDSTN